MTRFIVSRFLPFLILVVWTVTITCAAEGYFRITVVDEQTGRGVPLVELRTVNDVRYFTDSLGNVAFHEPGLMDQKVFFHISSHGHEFPKDGFGYRGKALQIKVGGSAKLEIRRINLAERLYRITGAGIYRDSVLLGIDTPMKQPVLNAQVFGSDSTVNAIYRGKLYWFWGDTNRPSYPLGNYGTPGATSLLPEDGGLDPDRGIDLTYFIDKTGFAKPTANLPGSGPTWIDGLVTLFDGRERLFAKYVKIKPPLTVYERGLAEFDDETKSFQRVAQFDLNAPVFPDGHPFKHVVAGIEYIYFPKPFPLVRVPATSEALRDLSQYEAFTCLKEGSQLDKPAVDRGPDGKLRYAWRMNAPPVDAATQAKLIRDGAIGREEALLQLCDRDTGKPVFAHNGSVYWNEYRRRWVMIAVEQAWEKGSPSFLGEVWFAEADTPVGPWVYATKILTHDKYTFYNPKQHPMFDKDQGRTIYFEGTYTHTFSGNSDRTPRYDYNQIMHKLHLVDPRAMLPVPVYRADESERAMFVTRRSIGTRQELLGIPFFAFDRPRPGAVGVYESTNAKGQTRLATVRFESSAEKKVLFHALPYDTKDPPPTTQPLYEFIHNESDSSAYSVDSNWSQPGYERSEKPLCLVWRNPLRISLPADLGGERQKEKEKVTLND